MLPVFSAPIMACFSPKKCATQLRLCSFHKNPAVSIARTKPRLSRDRSTAGRFRTLPYQRLRSSWRHVGVMLEGLELDLLQLNWTVSSPQSTARDRFHLAHLNMQSPQQATIWSTMSGLQNTHGFMHTVTIFLKDQVEALLRVPLHFGSHNPTTGVPSRCLLLP